MGLRVALAALAALALAGCPAPDPQEQVAVEVGDVDAFGTYVQPVIRDTCTSFDCHGRVERPLRLYGRWGLRLDASLRDQPETAEEIAANAAAMRTIDPDLVAGDSIVLLKPLAVDAGGMRHEGGDVFADPDEPGYVCLEAWLADEAGSSSAAQQACAQAAVIP